MTRAVPTRSATSRRHGAFAVVLVAILAVWNNAVIPQVPDCTAS